MKDDQGPTGTRIEGRGISAKYSLMRRIREGNGPYLAVAAILVLVICVATVQVILSNRKEQLAESSARSQELVGIFSGFTLNALEYTDNYVKAVRYAWQGIGAAGFIDDGLMAVPPDRAILSHIGILDAAGRPLYLSGGKVNITATATGTVADRAYFQFQKKTPGDEVYISLSYMGRVTGAQSMRLVRRIQTPSGEFAGIVLAAIPVRQFTEKFDLLNLGAQSSVMLVGLDHKIRARSKAEDFDPQMSVDESALWAELEKAQAGVFSEISMVDGIERTYAYRKIGDYPLVAVIGVAKGDVLVRTRDFTWSAVAIAALMTLVIVVLTSSIQRDARMLNALKHEVAVRRGAEDKAVRANEIKSTFLANMSHEVRTPINAIMGLFELIEQAEIPERQKRQARAGQMAAGELLKQLTNVLDVSRLEAKSLDLNIRAEQLAPLFSDLIHLLEAAIAKSGKPIKAVMEIIGDVPETVPMDRRRVDQIILNLIDNAVKFTSEGEIGLKISAQDDGSGRTLCIAVSDTGAGIPAKDLDRVFDRFAQIDGAITRRTGGTGLGLSICKELAALMHGDLTVESREGVGSVFILHLRVD